MKGCASSLHLTPQMFFIVCPLCFLAGLIDSIAGGGGLISIPAYLATGLPAHVAIGTNKLSAAVGTAAATLRYRSSGRMDLPCALISAALALPGSWLGTMIFNALPDGFVTRMMLVVIPIVAVLVLVRRGELRAAVALPQRLRLPVCAAIGFTIGLYDGLVGPGTGTFLILLFTLIVGMEAVTASGTAKVVNLASNVASLTTQIFAGNILFGLGLPAAVFGLLGNLAGARLAIRGGERIVWAMLVLVLALLMVNMVSGLL